MPDKFHPERTLTVDLVALFEFEEDFDQDFAAVNSVPPNDTLGPDTGLGLVRAHVAAGVVERAVYFDSASSYFYGPDASRFRTGKDKTICFWLKLSPRSSGNWRFIEKNTEYAFEVSATTRRLTVFGDFGSFFTHMKALDLDTWYFVAFWYDVSLGKSYVRFNRDIAESGALNSVVTPAGIAVGTEGVTLDQLGFWDRRLSGAEMDAVYNKGHGIAYADMVEAAEGDSCRAAVCTCD
ncbi:MAG TPA: hypothetical protein VJ063_15905 [Verrucomicrobiae bacterium]|nr:hypothetical protein [Verrucomicrobiae bacterium]